MGGLVDNSGNARGRKPDTWLDSCPVFSRPLCGELRELILRWAPDLAESIKWGSLCFSGHKLVCALGAFQKHAGLTFFRGTELPDPARLFNQGEGNTNALKTNKKAAAFFASLAPTYQREYLVWLTTAKREETRAQRLAQTLAALAAGRKWAQRELV